MTKTYFTDSTHRYVSQEAASGKTSSDDRPLTSVQNSKLVSGLISLYGRDRVSAAMRAMLDKFGDPVPDEQRTEAIKFLTLMLKRYKSSGRTIGGTL